MVIKALCSLKVYILQNQLSPHCPIHTTVLGKEVREVFIFFLFIGSKDEEECDKRDRKRAEAG